MARPHNDEVTASQLAKLRRLHELQQNYGLFFYAPYGKQREFHALGASKKERLLMAGNKLGKCITIGSLIDTPNGLVPVEKLHDGSFVYAWDGQRKVVALCREPFEKAGLHSCYRLLMSDGRFIDCADHHRILTDEGWRFVESLLPSAPNLPVSNVEPCLAVHDASVLHSTQKPANFLDRCALRCHRYGERLRCVATIALTHLLRRGDVPTCTHFESHWGAQDNSDTSNDRLLLDLPSSWDVLRHFVGRCVASVILAAYKLSEQNPRSHLIAPLLSTAANLLLRSAGGFAPQGLHASPSETLPFSTPCVDGNHIIAIIPIGRHKVYDFTVPNYHNYCAAGLVHHNTFSGGFEVAFHTTGLYPDWWEGRRFVRSNRWWAGCVTGELTRDGQQRVLLGPIGKWGTGAIPKDLIIDIKRAKGIVDAVESVLIRHVPTNDVSQLIFKSYADGREAWQAEDLEGVWFDEEPPMNIYIEGITRTNVTGGITFLTFTPLLGMSGVVRRFLGDDQDGANQRSVTYMTIDDADHFTPEERADIIAKYPPHEREARAKGIPMLGKGRIFPVSEASIAEPPLAEIPSHWHQLIGIDFGWDHPTAAVRIAYDPTNDCIHLVSAYRQSEATPVVHAAAIRAWGDWIPVAWPKDALQHDKGSGEQLAHLYRKQGLKMLSEYAQFPDKRGVGVEDGIADMLERMQTGRFKVDINLAQWWEEFRIYHRKATPEGAIKIVKEFDDLLCATRYAVMMLRYAIPLEYAPPPHDRYATQRNSGDTSWMSM